MTNTLTVSEIKRRGMAAIEEGLRHGPLHIVKRNKPAAVVLSEPVDQRLLTAQSPAPHAAPGLTAVQWLLKQKTSARRTRAEIDAEMAAQRDW